MSVPRCGTIESSIISYFNISIKSQILNALRRKVTLSDDIDVHEYAQLTDGYSGADLQALVYNAHLDAVHASITEAEAQKPLRKQNGTVQSQRNSSSASYTTFGGIFSSGSGVLSKADESVREQRVCLFALD